jgi:WD repeat-containing protein 35
VSNCRWNSSGTILAVTGSQVSQRGDTVRTINQVKFYDPFGKYLRNIRIPGESISGITWEGSGLRIALAVDSNIFFANIRPAYTWAYLLNSVVLSHGGGSSNKNGIYIYIYIYRYIHKYICIHINTYTYIYRFHGDILGFDVE